MADLSRSQKVRLGAFLAVGLGSLVAAVLLLAGRTILEDRDFYSIRFSDPNLSFSGLETGSAVKYSGIRIGRVEDIHIAEEDVSVIVVDISLHGGTPVAENSEASLGTVGITGLKYVELSRGSPDARIREPGENIPAGPSLMDELSARALTVAEQLETILENIKVLTNEENQTRVAKLLDDSTRMMEENQENLQRITANLADFTETGVEVVDQVNAFTEELGQTREQLDLLIKDGRHSLGPKGLMGTVDGANKLLDQANLMVRRNQRVVESSLRDLQTSAENLYDLTETVKDNPSLLFRGNRSGGEDLVR